MSGGLFGSAPSVSSTPNVTKQQQGIQSLVGGVLQSILGVPAGAISGLPSVPSTAASNVTAGQPAFPSPTGGVYAAPVTPGEQTDINAIQAQTQPGSYAADVNQNAATALTQILSGQPQDYSQYFAQDVAAPYERVFSQSTLPAVKAAFARSAGGTYSGSNDPTTGGTGNTGYSAAVRDITENLNENLQQGQTALTTQAITNAANNQVKGAALAPSISATPQAEAQAALSAQGLPQNTQQAQIAGQVGQGNTAMQQLISLLTGGVSLGTSPTVSQIVNPGQTGLIPSILGGAAGNSGLASAIFGPTPSDPRVKDSKGKEDGRSALDKIVALKVENAKYKGEAKGRERPMVMADNVKRQFPRAVPQKTGGRQTQTVNMAELIPTMVAAIQELAKQKRAA